MLAIIEALIEALADHSTSADDVPLNEIIDFGRKALRQRQSEELAFALLGLDGVRLPLEAPRLTARDSG
jgi:hypothetical protein